MTSENPTQNSREIFDENEVGIAQKKQEITQALESGDFDSVATLAQEAKSMETARLEMSTISSEAIDDNKAFDEARAAEEKAQRDAERAEQARLQSEKDVAEAAEVLARLQGQGTQGAVAESSPTEQVEPTTVETTNEEDPMILKYGEKMRQDADRLAEINGQMTEKYNEIDAAAGTDKQPGLRAELQSLRNERRGLMEDTSFFKFRPQKAGERTIDYFDYKDDEVRKFSEAQKNDPYTASRLVEAGLLKVGPDGVLRNR